MNTFVVLLLAGSGEGGWIWSRGWSKKRAGHGCSRAAQQITRRWARLVVFLDGVRTQQQRKLEKVAAVGGPERLCRLSAGVLLAASSNLVESVAVSRWCSWPLAVDRWQESQRRGRESRRERRWDRIGERDGERGITSGCREDVVAGCGVRAAQGREWRLCCVRFRLGRRKQQAVLL